jgi:hypothetical protein
MEYHNLANLFPLLINNQGFDKVDTSLSIRSTIGSMQFTINCCVFHFKGEEL